MAHDAEQIRKQAKAIMDEFIAALEKVPEAEFTIGFEREDGVRPPAKCQSDPEFKQRMLKNAPKVKDDCIVAEKKQW